MNLLIAILPFLLCSFNNSFYDAKNTFISQSDNYAKADYFASSNNKHVKCLNPERTVEGSCISFDFESQNEILSISLSNQIIDFQYEINNNFASVLFSGLDDENTIILNFSLCNNESVTSTLYVVKNEGSLYSSNLSLDDAKRTAGIDLYYNIEPLIDDAETEDTLPSRFGYANGRIYGHLYWSDGKTEELHPLVSTRVNLSLTNSIWTKTVYTDSEGYYSIPFKGIGHLFQSYTPIITISLVSEFVVAGTLSKLIPSAFGLYYSKSYSLNFNNGDELQFSNVFFPTDDFGKAIQPFQACVLYSEFAQRVCEEGKLRTCSIIYPYVDKDEPGTTGYSDNTIFLDVSDDYYAIAHNRPCIHEAWDVVGHEYGHHVMHCNGINKSPGGNHSGGNLIDELTSGDHPLPLNKAKIAALYLAWEEGFATFWGVTVQQHFPENIKTIIPFVGDSDSTSPSTETIVLNAVGLFSSSGETNEDTICRLLYQICDEQVDYYDNFYIQDEILFSIVFSNQINTLSSLIITLYELGYDYVTLGRLLHEYRLTTVRIEMTGGDYLDVPPTFSWSDDYGTSLLSFNEFDLFITDGQSLLLTVSNISATHYTLSKYEWSSVWSQTHSSTYIVHIISKQTNYMFSGYYCSHGQSFSIPEDYYSKSLIKPTQWGFEPQYFFIDNKWRQTSNPITNKWLTITHDRLRCGYIENSYVVLSPKRKNAGMAYLTMNFNIPVHWYKLNISLWSNSEGLSPSNCTAYIQEKNADGFWTTRFDLLNNYALSTNPEYMNTLEFDCPNDIYGLRIIVTSPATGDRNKGRICLGNMIFDAIPYASQK